MVELLPRNYGVQDPTTDVWPAPLDKNSVCVPVSPGAVSQAPTHIDRRSGHLSGCVRSNAVFSMLGFRLGLALSPTSKTTADRFEAMVHGIRQDANGSELEPWIEKVFTPLIEEGCLVVAQKYACGLLPMQIIPLIGPVRF